MTVYIVTDSELGWDCIVEVYDNPEAAEEHVKSRNGGTHGTSNYFSATVEESYED